MKLLLLPWKYHGFMSSQFRSWLKWHISVFLAEKIIYQEDWETDMFLVQGKIIAIYIYRVSWLSWFSENRKFRVMNFLIFCYFWPKYFFHVCWNATIWLISKKKWQWCSWFLRKRGNDFMIGWIYLVGGAKILKYKMIALLPSHF